MNLSWFPVVVVDMVGSVLTLFIAVLCAYRAWQWLRGKRNDVFRHYLFLLTIAFVLFAVSRSFGHLVKQILHQRNLDHIWQQISPFSGAVNTVTFVIVASFSIYFNRQQRVHQEIEKYKTGLESLVEERTRLLAESHATLESVLNAANPICMVNLDCEILDANIAYCEIWPLRDESGKQLKCYESRPGSACQTQACPVALISGGTSEVVQEQIKHFYGGDSRQFIVTARPFKDSTGQLIGVVQSFQDVTERERATAALVAEREQLTVTLRSLGEGVITADTAGSIVLINKAAEQITGWSQEGALGRPLAEVFDIFSDDPETTFSGFMEQTLAGVYETIKAPTVLIARDGTKKLVSESGAPVSDAEGKVRGVVLVFRDVTEKRRIEDELAKIKKLETVGILAGGIAHDFNNILTAILGNINLALTQIDPEEPIHELLSSAEKATNRATNLTMQLLTFSGGGAPVKTMATIQDIIEDSAGFVLRGSNVQCGYHFADDLWAAEIDTGQISQVIQNIILNAAAAMIAGGTIDIHCRNHLQDADSPVMAAGQYVRIAISDQGIGIAPDIREKIFDPFFSTKKSGSGLGLAITHSIVSKHRGHIEVESRPGEGAVFTIYLPAAGEVAVESGTTAKRFAGTSAGGRVLIMDDDEMIRDLAGRMLERLGYETEFARDGMEAVKIFADARSGAAGISLIIMDLTVPGGMGGKDAVKEVLKIDPQAKVVVSSGYSNDPIMAHFAEYGFCAAMTKPYRLETLQDMLARVLA